MPGLDNELLNRCFRFTAMGGGSSDEDDNSTTDSNEWSDAWQNWKMENYLIESEFFLSRTNSTMDSIKKKFFMPILKRVSSLYFEVGCRQVPYII